MTDRVDDAQAGERRSGARVAVLSSMALSRFLVELATACKSRLGIAVAIEAVGGVDAERRIGDREPFDLAVLAAQAIDRLAASGRVDATSRVAIARSAMAMAVAPGVAPPPIPTADAVRDAVLAARRVAYSTGPSGRHFLDLLARWGIAERLASRLLLAPPGISVASLLARGDAEIGFQQASELMGTAGVAIAGPLPPDIGAITVFSGAVCTAAGEPLRARDVLAYFTSGEAHAAMPRHGLHR